VAVAVASVLAAMALVVLDAAGAALSLPTIRAELEVSAAMSVRVLLAYQIALLIALLPVAALGESFGYRRIFSLGLAIFIAASLFCAAAPSIAWLLAARFVQGLGAAAIMALGVALLRQAVPERLGAAIGWSALTVALCSAAGPLCAAMTLAMGGWRWLFLAYVPVGLLALLAARALPYVKGAGRSLDYSSVALSGAGFASLLLGLEALVAAPAAAAFLLFGSAACFALLVRRELPKSAPLLPVDLLRGRSFRLSVIASICCFAGQTSGMLALSFRLQEELGQSPFAAGLYMTPWPVAVAAAALFSGRLSRRLSAAFLCTAGAGLLSLGLAGAAILPLSGDPIALAALTILCGLGFGLFQVPNNRTMFLAAPESRSAAAGGMQGSARLLGQTGGALVMTLLFTWDPGIPVPRTALALGAIVSLGAAIVSALRARPTGETRAETRT
jgi:DHA2 family multidrug resistance protein-like MFS transporter